MYSSSYELSTPVVDNKYVKKKVCAKIPCTHAKNIDDSGVRYPTDTKQPGFDRGLKSLAGLDTLKSCDFY